MNATHVTVRNGVLRGWGGRGVEADTAYSSQLVDLRASHNGGDGMSLGPGGIIMGCTAPVNGGDGIEALSLCNVSACSATQNGGNGIIASTGTTIRGGTTYTNVGDGIQVTSDCQVVDNTCDGNRLGAVTAAGIHVVADNNRVERNNTTTNGRGLDIDAANNSVSDNSVRSNTDSSDIAAGNQLRLILSQPRGGLRPVRGDRAPPRGGALSKTLTRPRRQGTARGRARDSARFGRVRCPGCDTALSPDHFGRFGADTSLSQRLR